jgi:hypothetical protein
MFNHGKSLNRMRGSDLKVQRFNESRLRKRLRVRIWEAVLKFPNPERGE